MLSQSLVSAVERDLTVARQLAYFYIGYSPDGQDMEIEPEQFVSAAPTAAAAAASAAPAAAPVNSASQIRVVLSNPVQRPRQGTCAVLMELTRPLPWLSQRGRSRAAAAAAASAATSATPSGTTTSGSRGVSTASATAAGNPLHTSFPPGGNTSAAAAGLTAALGGVSGSHPNGSMASAGSGHALTSSSFAATASHAAANAAPPLGTSPATATVGGLAHSASTPPQPASHRSSHLASASNAVNASGAGGAAAAAAALPLLVATATLEVVFPSRYPQEPCQWLLSEEVSFGGVGDHSTSSWAVTTTGHHRPASRSLSHLHHHHHSSGSANSGSKGVWSSGSPLYAEEAVPRGPISGRLIAATSGNNSAKMAGSDSSNATTADSAATAAAVKTAKLTAFVIPALGRRLLRWINESRLTAASPSPPCSPTARTAAAGSLFSSRPAAFNGRTGNTNDASPFLLDFACLLRCWTAVELDVHQLLLPSRIALAYGGAGAHVLRAMSGTHLSGRGGAAAAATATGTTSGAAVNSAASATTTGPLTTATASVNLSPSTAYTGGGVVGGGGGKASAFPGGNSAGAGGLSVSGGAGVAAGGSTGSTSTATTSTAFLPAPVLMAGAGTSGGAAAGSVGGAAVMTGGGGSGPTASSPPASGAAAAGTGTSALYPHRRRASKPFMAVMLPLGGVALWGSVSPGAVGRRPGHAAAAAAETADGEKACPDVLQKTPASLRVFYERNTSQQRSDEAAAAASVQQQRQQRIPPSGTMICCTSQFTRGKALPSFLLPAHVLGSAYKCTWDDVFLFTGRSADFTLHVNAKLAKALRLADVSDLLQVLRRLAKNVGTPTTGVLYVGELVWPMLMEAVRVLRTARLPFWAGLAVCSLLLPAVLEHDEAPHQQQLQLSQPVSSGGIGVLPIMSSQDTQRNSSGNGGSERRWRRHLGELIAVVTYTERLLAIAREYTLLCEARLVRCALQRGQQLLTERISAGGSSSTGGLATEANRGACSVALPPAPLEMCRRVHAPISVCAVCGLSLVRNTVIQAAGGAEKRDSVLSTVEVVGEGGKGSSRSKRSSKGAVADVAAAAAAIAAATNVRATLQARRVEGCLVVQCARCGHGGHVEHISSWWADPTVHCCPKGCDCICEY